MCAQSFVSSRTCCYSCARVFKVTFGIKNKLFRFASSFTWSPRCVCLVGVNVNELWSRIKLDKVEFRRHHLDKPSQLTSNIHEKQIWWISWPFSLSKSKKKSELTGIFIVVLFYFAFLEPFPNEQGWRWEGSRRRWWWWLKCSSVRTILNLICLYSLTFSLPTVSSHFKLDKQTNMHTCQ